MFDISKVLNRTALSVKSLLIIIIAMTATPRTFAPLNVLRYPTINS